MNKDKILKALKADFTASKVLHDQQQAKIRQWVNQFEGKPYGNEEKGKSQIVSMDGKRQSEWQHSSIIDPFVSSPDIIKATPITFEDGDGARQAEILLNNQFCRQFPRYNFMSKAVKVMDREGTCKVQVGWDYKEEEIEVEQPAISVDEITGEEYISGTEMVKETRIVRNQPTARVCRNEDVFVDPTCQDDMDNCQFVIYRYETDLSTLRQDGRYRNLEKVAKSAMDKDYDYEEEDDSGFEYSDNPRKKLVVHEYWGNYDINDDGIAEPIVCAWINDIIIRLQDNPYPDKKVPFIVVPFNAVPFQMDGESNMEFIGDNQKVKTAITRGIIDNMAQSNNGQKGIRKGALDLMNKKRFMGGANFEFNGTPNDFWDGSYNQIPGSAFDMIGLMNKEIESMTGTMGFSGGISNSGLSKSATGARGILDATAVRRLNIVRNISENLVKPLMRKWLAYNAEFLTEEQVVRHTNDEFVEIRKDDIAGEIDLDIHVSTAEDNSAKAQELAFMLQTGQQTMDQGEVKMIRSEIARLQKMPELAKRIEEYQPEPDPVQQQIQQMELENKQLENAKLKAEIAKLQSEAAENEGDEREKHATAAVKEAQARKLHADADNTIVSMNTPDKMPDALDDELRYQKARAEAAKADKLESEKDKLDLSFIADESETSHRQKLEENQQKMDHDLIRDALNHEANMEQMREQSRAGDKQIRSYDI